MPKKKSPKAADKKTPKDLLYKPRLVWDHLTNQEQKQVTNQGELFKEFLNSCKTEREAVRYIMAQAEKKGFVPASKAKPGDKFYLLNRQKNIALVRPAKKSVLDGFRLIASHIDAPRLDLKQNPLYQELDIAFLKTHYYGGIKKYQWLSRPLAIHGRIILSDGKELDICLGEDPSDPLFTIMDLLPHLAQKQANKKMSEAIEGEKLNLVVGSLPEKKGKEEKNEKDRVKMAILNILNKKYGLVEEDFVSSELEVVPADKARDLGFDRSLVGGYGQDDRINAFCSLQAILNTGAPPNTCVAMFLDKEEIGSDGNTGAQSNFLEIVTETILELEKADSTQKNLRKSWYNSKCISADVNGAMDPDYQDVHEKRNAALLGYGVCLTKFTGSRGKYSASDANAEFMGWVRRIFNRNNVIWQAAELGKVDAGGGGTIAKYLAKYGMEVIDCGPAILGMHSPFEVSSKADVFMTRKAFLTFYSEK